MNHRANCFDIIRHGAALLVLYSHHYALSRYPEPRFRHWDTFGFIAVAIFFSLSGYLMPGSFGSSRNFVDFMIKRLRRLLPGLIVCSFLMVYVIGAIFSPTPLSAYLFSSWTFNTFAQFSFFLGRSIPGVFDHFRFPLAINGSLWSLPVEVICYVIFGAAMSIYKSWKTSLILLMASIYTAALTIHSGTSFSFYTAPLSYLGIFGICFSSGALLAMTKDAWYPHRAALICFALVSLYLIPGRSETNILCTMSIALLVAIIGESFKDPVIKGRFDLSYGIYIYAFPIQQLVINLIDVRFRYSLLISLILTLVAAYLSHRFVEKPFLKKRKIIRKTSASGQVPELSGNNCTR